MVNFGRWISIDFDSIYFPFLDFNSKKKNERVIIKHWTIFWMWYKWIIWTLDRYRNLLKWRCCYIDIHEKEQGWCSAEIVVDTNTGLLLIVVYGMKDGKHQM